MGDRYRFITELWAPETTGAWVFASVPEDASVDIRSTPRDPSTTFGSIRVEATLGDSRWATSIFSDSRRGVYLLPVKKAIRTSEGVDLSDSVDITIELV